MNYCPICWRAFGVRIQLHQDRPLSITDRGREALRAWEARRR